MNYNRLTNLPVKKEYRKKLRNNMPQPEKVLWYYLRKRQLLGIKFRRQVSIGSFIVDFFSFEKNLIIEIDGESHFISEAQKQNDRMREKFLVDNGYKIIRFLNTDVINNVEFCLESIKDCIIELKKTPSNSP